MTNLTKRVSNQMTTSKSVGGAVGKGMAVAGASVLGTTALAAFIPFVSAFWLGAINATWE